MQVTFKRVTLGSLLMVAAAHVYAFGGDQPPPQQPPAGGKVSALPSGTYSITATKTGFVDAAFGQRRALRSGTPIELSDGQQLSSVDLKLARGGVVTGRVLDEDGEPIARAVVTVLRQQYVRGEKQLAPAGSDQSDDRGQFRVFGLPPGDYYVSAAAGAVERILRQLVDPGAVVDAGRSPVSSAVRGCARQPGRTAPSP